MLIGYLIHHKYVSPWLAAIASTSNVLPSSPYPPPPLYQPTGSPTNTNPTLVESVALLAYILLLVLPSPLAKYLLISVAVACSVCVYPVLWPERIRAASGTTGSGLAIGVTNASAQLMGIIGPQVYQARFGPQYRVSYGTSIGLLVGAVGGIGATWWLLGRRGRS